MRQVRRTVGLVLVLVVMATMAGVMAACGGEERPEGSVSVSGTETGTHAEAEPGVVEPKPEGATEVKVRLQEWAVIPAQTEVRAGSIYFLADNAGEEPHELVVIRSDEEPDALPVEDGKVSEDDVDLIGEIEAFAAGSQASGVFDLEPGNYVLICNIVEEEEDGELESHYQMGMYTRFVVTE